jgi:tripartite-type tricarboxylate transporter receptor subunit TctC
MSSALAGTRRCLLVVCVLICAAPVTAAVDFPARTVRIIVGYTPGTTSDVIARLIAQRLTMKWNRQVIVENRDGASGIVAAEIAARANPDGHTLFLTSNALVLAPYLRVQVAFDPFRDFVALSQVAQVPNVFLVGRGLGVTSVKDLIALAKANPGKIRYASSGRGTPSQLSVELFKSMAGVDIEEVPYKSSAQALIDALTGEVAMNAPGLAQGLPHVKSGRAVALAITGSKRSVAAPDIPTVAEQGVAGYEAYGWYGVFIPAKTPPELRAFLVKEMIGIVSEPEMRERFLVAGAEPIGSSTAQFTAFLRTESDKWGKLFQRLGIKPD